MHASSPPRTCRARPLKSVNSAHFQPNSASLDKVCTAYRFTRPVHVACRKRFQVAVPHSTTALHAVHQPSQPGHLAFHPTWHLQFALNCAREHTGAAAVRLGLRVLYPQMCYFRSRTSPSPARVQLVRSSKKLHVRIRTSPHITPQNTARRARISTWARIVSMKPNILRSEVDLCEGGSENTMIAISRVKKPLKNSPSNCKRQEVSKFALVCPRRQYRENSPVQTF